MDPKRLKELNSEVYVNNIIFWSINPNDYSSCSLSDELAVHFEIGTITAVDVDGDGKPLKGSCVVTSPTGLRTIVNYHEGLRDKTVKVIRSENIFTVQHLKGFLREMEEDRRKYMKRHHIHY